MIPSRQEMFNRAVIGLRSQGWEKCTDDDSCVYTNYTKDGVRHCAWGWVDTSLSDVLYSLRSSVTFLHTEGKGIAGRLNTEDLIWAQELQYTHDDSCEDLEYDFRKFATKYGLSWPDEEVL